MIKILLLLVLLLTSCTTQPRLSLNKTGIDPEFKPYIEEYRSIIGRKKYQYSFSRLTVVFAELEPDVAGRCWWVSLSGKKIEINIHWWRNPNSSQISKRLVVYHELEHCIRYRMHTNKATEIHDLSSFFDEIGYLLGLIPKPGFFEDGCPVSLMNSQIAGSACQEKYYNVWIKEMEDL